MHIQGILQAVRRRAPATGREPSLDRARTLNQGFSRLVQRPANPTANYGIPEANTGPQVERLDDMLTAWSEDWASEWAAYERQKAQELSDRLKTFLHGRTEIAPAAAPFPADTQPSLLQSTEAPDRTPPPLLDTDDHRARSDAASQPSLPTPTSVADPMDVARDVVRPERLFSASPTPRHIPPQPLSRTATVGPLPSRTESSANAAGTKRPAPTTNDSPSKRAKNDRKNRTIDFETVYGNGNPKHKYIIIDRVYKHTRYPELKGRYWILRCKDHNTHFANKEGSKSVIKGAGSHLSKHDTKPKRPRKSDPKQEFLASFEAFGVLVKGCSKERMEMNNDFVMSSLAGERLPSPRGAPSQNKSGAEASNPIVIPSEDELESSTEHETLPRPRGPDVVRQRPTWSSDMSFAVKQEDTDIHRPAAPEARIEHTDSRFRLVQAGAPQRRENNTTGQASSTPNMQSPSRITSSTTLGRGQTGHTMNRLAAPSPQPVTSDIPSEAGRRREDRNRNRDAVSEVEDLYGATPPPEMPIAPVAAMEASVPPQPFFSPAPERSAAQVATARIYRQRQDELEPEDTWGRTRQLFNGA